MEITEMTK
jgi:hypothetical protein